MSSTLFRLPRRHHAKRDDAGFTVLEALVSFALFAVIGGSSVTAIVNANTTSKDSSDRVNAADLAAQDLQQARTLDYPNYPTSVAAHSVIVGNTTYTVTRSVPSPCPTTSNFNSQTTMLVTTTVTWAPVNAANTVVMATEIAC
jgi:type II secretory pathway pseudopilin PulG